MIIADKLISRKIVKKLKGEVTLALNPFLQDAMVDTRSGEDCLPASLQRIIRVVKKHKVAFKLLTININLRER